MKNLHIELLKRISNSNITLLKDVNKQIQINKNGKFKYYYLPFFDFNKIIEFIDNLENNYLYTIIPLIFLYGRDEDPHIILSKQILISSFSNPRIINDYLIKQLEKIVDDFGINLENKFYYLIFKYKKIEIII